MCTQIHRECNNCDVSSTGEHHVSCPTVKVRKSLLVNGQIPDHTECPFVNECEFKREGQCQHHGVNHQCEFSCASARFFDLFQKRRGC